MRKREMERYLREQVILLLLDPEQSAGFRDGRLPYLTMMRRKGSPYLHPTPQQLLMALDWWRDRAKQGRTKANMIREAVASGWESDEEIIDWCLERGVKVSYANIKQCRDARVLPLFAVFLVGAALRNGWRVEQLQKRLERAKNDQDKT